MLEKGGGGVVRMDEGGTIVGKWKGDGGDWLSECMGVFASEL